MRRVGKITRQKVFREVKNVNVKSLKNGSKLLDFWSGSLPQPLPKGKGFVAALMHRTWGSFLGDQRDEERESGRAK